MTEDEAKTKWCPFVRIVRLEPLPEQTKDWVHVSGVNTDALGRCRIPASCTCIASACMAWRWIDDGFRWDGPGAWPQTNPGKPAQGYCGLSEPCSCP